MKSFKGIALLFLGFMLVTAVIALSIQINDLRETKASFYKYKGEVLQAELERSTERSTEEAVLKTEIREWKTKYYAVMKLPNEQLTEFITIFVKTRQPRSSTDVARLISKAVVKYSNEYDLPPGLLVGIIEAESRYNPMALSKAKARGLMQIMFKVWGKALKIQGYKELYEIDPNVRYGSKILKILLKQEGSLSKALSKYLGTTKSSKYRAEVLSTFAEFELDKHQFLNTKPAATGIPVTVSISVPKTMKDITSREKQGTTK